MSTPQDVFGTSPKTVLNKPLFHVRYETASGVNGVGIADSADTILPLNTVLTSQIDGASLGAGGEINLPAGEYYVEGDYLIGGDPSGADNGAGYLALKEGERRVLKGTNFHARAQLESKPVFISGRMSFSNATSLDLVAYAAGFGSTTGNPQKISDGTNEIWASLKIWKLDSDVTTLVISDPGKTLSRPLMHIQWREAQSTNGDIAAGENLAAMNTVIANDIVGATLGGDGRVNLPAGTYFVEYHDAMYEGVNDYKVQARVKNTAGEVLRNVGDRHVLTTGVGVSSRVSVSGRIVLNQTDDVGFYLYSSVTSASGRTPTENGTEVFADAKIWQLDALQLQPILVNDKLYPLPGGVLVTGNMHGLDYARTGDNEVTIQPGICMDSLNETVLSLAAPQVLSIPLLASTVYNLFLCDDGFVRTDTDENGANLVGYKIRWIGFVRNNSSGVLVQFLQNGDGMSFGIVTENQLGASESTTFVTMDHSHMVPITRIREIEYSFQRLGGSGSNFWGTTSIDGVNTECQLGDTDAAVVASTAANAWGRETTRAPAMLPFSNGRFFRCENVSTSFVNLIRQVRMKR